ncbi:UvrD-helicase domain-containing protein [Paraburkholderia sp. RL17-347-BIC-D]|uniref:UvrD-helicase domain-containing protein n=1 Tax=Paraburkholderia sp. RL17-347-BIC-D TaxID=3031632 RepID=UPI0038BA0A1D
MNSTWWRKPEQLDDAQRAFIQLPISGRYLLEGPPGSGKTNLLLLRAQYIAGAGEKNVLILTFTKTLANFIRSGIAVSGLISPTQVRTFHSWAYEHARDHDAVLPMGAEDDFGSETREKMLKAVCEANKKLVTPKPYSAIFVDEAQDFSVEELEALLCLSDKVCICGDVRQGIYKQDGLDVAVKLNLERHVLTAHYRIGQAIAHVADRLISPESDKAGLEELSNYNSKVQGKSSAEMHALPDRDAQFVRMVELLRIQLDAFKGEPIGILCGKRETLLELKQRFEMTDLAQLVCVHGLDADAMFGDGRLVHILTMHSAKGTEFRAVHLYGTEELKGFGLNHRQLGYTAITRARTALNAYRTGDTNKPLETAFATPSVMPLAGLFPE